MFNCFRCGSACRATPVPGKHHSQISLLSLPVRTTAFIIATHTHAHAHAHAVACMHLYSSSRADLKRGVKKAKHSYKLKIEEHLKNNSDPRRMWQGIQAITDYKPTNTSPQTGEASLPDELN